MNIREISAKSGVGVKALAKLERMGVLKVDAENMLAAEIRFHLARSKTLTVAYMLALLDDPSLLEDLGNYQDRAKRQIAALGNVKESVAPNAIRAYVRDAGQGSPTAAQCIATWARSIAPAGGVSYHWLAVRLLIGAPENLMQEDLRAMRFALLNVRKFFDFTKKTLDL